MNLTHAFYKENGIWYIDLPEFLDAGLGTKANLMMVAGADTFLDKISNNGKRVKIEIGGEFSTMQNLNHYDYHLLKTNYGMDKQLLDSVGHAPVDYGAYYDATKIGADEIDHKLWLCPVTEYVFGGYYPEVIYIKVLSVH